MKSIYQLTVLFALLNNLGFSQDEKNSTYKYVGKKNNSSVNICLVNSLDSSKKIRLSDYYSIKYNEKIMDTILEKKSITLRGSIDETSSIDNSSIVFNFYSEYIFIRAKNGANSENTLDFYDTEFGTNNRKIDLSDIESINYSSSRRIFFSGMGGFISSISLFTTLVIAPIISIHFKDGTFEKEKYYASAGGGLIGFFAGLPLIAANQDKTYLITTKNGEKGKKYWYIQIDD